MELLKDMKDSFWIRRRWLDFRQGHSFYLIFALTFANFILIFHRLLVERIPSLNEIFSSLWGFAIVFILLYIPVAVIIGAWHRKTQLRVEQEQYLRNNPFLVKIWRIQLDVILGKASQDEIEYIRKLLKSMEK